MLKALTCNQKGFPMVWHRVKGFALATGLLMLCMGYALGVCLVLFSPLLFLMLR